MEADCHGKRERNAAAVATKLHLSAAACDDTSTQSDAYSSDEYSMSASIGPWPLGRSLWRRSTDACGIAAARHGLILEMVVRMPSASRLFFVCSSATIIGLTLPWSDWQNHTHWATVQWIPFVTPPVRAADIAENVLLYVPYGIFYPHTTLRRRWSSIILTALALSCITEWTQLYSHSRFPSLTDVTCNGIGAALGAALRSVASRFPP